MIGRFSKLGEYQELFQKRELLQCLAGGLLALAAYVWEVQGLAPGWIGLGLGLIAVALTGLPIVWGAAQGLMQRRVNVDELVALAIAASLIQGEVVTAAVVGFIMGLIAVIKYKDRALLTLLSIPVGIIIIAWTIAEIAFPH